MIYRMLQSKDVSVAELESIHSFHRLFLCNCGWPSLSSRTLRFLSLFRALSATPTRPVPSRSKVVGSGTVDTPVMTVPGVKLLNLISRLCPGGMPVPFGPVSKTIPLRSIGLETLKFGDKSPIHGAD